MSGERSAFPVSCSKKRLIGRWIGAAIGVVASRLGLVEQSRDVEVLPHPGLVRVLAGQPQGRFGAVHPEADVGGLLAGQSRPGQQLQGDRLVQGRIRGAAADHHAAHAVVTGPVDVLVEPHQPGDFLRLGVEGDSPQGDIALEPDSDPLVRDPVDDHRRLDPFLGLVIDIRLDHLPVDARVDGDLNRVERLGGEITPGGRSSSGDGQGRRLERPIASQGGGSQRPHPHRECTAARKLPHDFDSSRSSEVP